MSETHPEKKGLSAHWAVDQVDHLFGRLARYTRFVVFSKWFLLLFSCMLAVTLIALPLVSKDRSGIRISFVDRASAPDAPAASPVMNNPEFRGVDSKGQPYKINGIRAIQMTPSQIRMEQMRGLLTQDNGGWKTLAADQADYDQDKKIIELTGHVTVVDDKDYHFTSSQATINTANMDITGHEPITGTGPLGNLLASSDVDSIR